MSISASRFESQRALSIFFWYAVFCHIFFLFSVVWVHNRIPLGPDIPGIIRIIYLACVYTYRVLLPLLLLLCTGVVASAAAAVRRRLPDDKQCCWFIESDSIECLLSFH